jgi:hypothetical protein
MMLIYLALGVIIAFLLARLTTNTITGAVVGGIADEGLAGAVRTVVDTTVANLREITAIILVATGIVAIAAYLWGRPRWVTSAASSLGGAAGQAGTSAKAAGAAGVGAVAASRPSRESVEATVRENRPTIERLGLAAIVFVVVWIALGIEIALIGAVLVITFELILRALSSPDEGQPAVASGGAAAAVPAVQDADSTTAEREVPDSAPATEAGSPSPAPKPKRARTTKKPPSS